MKWKDNANGTSEEFVKYSTAARPDRDEWLLEHPEYYREVYLGVLGHKEVKGVEGK